VSTLDESNAIESGTAWWWEGQASRKSHRQDKEKPTSDTPAMCALVQFLGLRRGPPTHRADKNIVLMGTNRPVYYLLCEPLKNEGSRN